MFSFLSFCFLCCLFAITTIKLHCYVSVLSAFFFFVNKTKWLFGLHLVVLFLFWVVLCSLFCFFCSFIPFKKDPKKPDTAKNPKNQTCRKRGQTKDQLAQLCSQIVFLIFWGWATKMLFFAEPPIKIGVWANSEKGKEGPIMWKRLRWKSVQFCCAT